MFYHTGLMLQAGDQISEIIVQNWSEKLHSDGTHRGSKKLIKNWIEFTIYWFDE